ncbi:MAG: MFS transporter [Acidobacteriota bacterium]|jgi:MFS family permease|nr:MFS transporter [Acidobacteriota bacterium]
MKTGDGQNSAISYRSARSSLALLLFINLFNYIDRQVLSAVVGPIKRTFFNANGELTAAGSDSLNTAMHWFEHQLGFKPEDAMLGLLGTAFMVVYMIGAPLFARVAERRSRWWIVAWGVILWSLASGATGLAGTFLLLLLTRCFVGVGEAAYGPVAPAMISDLYPIEHRGQKLAWFYVAMPVGSALGYVLGGWIANSQIGAWGHATLGLGAESWRWVFFLITIPGIILGLICFRMKEPPRGGAGAQKPGSQGIDGYGVKVKSIPWRDYWELARTPSYVLCTFGMAAMTFAIQGIAFWMPYYMEGLPGAPENATIVFGGIIAVAGLCATLLGGVIADKLRKRFASSYFLVSGIAMIVGFPIFLAALRAPFPLMWVLMFLTCFCLFFNTGPTNTVLANVTRSPIRAIGFAVNIFVIHALGDVISPVIVGLLNDVYGDMHVSFIVVGMMFLVAGALWLAGAFYLKRDTERAAV